MKKYAKTTPDTIARFVELAADGYSPAEIAAETGRARQIVEYHLKKRGEYFSLLVHTTPEQQARAVQWYRRGAPVKRICRQFGMGAQTLYKALDTHGVARRGRVGR